MRISGQIVILDHDDFLEPHPLTFPYGPGEFPGWEFYALGSGTHDHPAPFLLGPFPLVIQMDELSGTLLIKCPGGPYHDNYGGPNAWGQSGYYLRFFPAGTLVTFTNRKRRKKRHVHN